MAYRVIHYLNQFFGGIGGEEKADHPPELREGPVGPGRALQEAFGGQAEIVATIICGDNHAAGHPEEVAAFIGKALDKYPAEGLAAGPAFNAGRYGLAAGMAASAAAARGLAALAAMFPENPGVAVYKAETFILPTTDSARGMAAAIPLMAAFALKLLSGRKLGSASEEGYIERGVRVNTFHDEIGAERAVDMLLKKIKGRPFVTEYKMPVFDRVTPRPGVKDLSRATVALVTSGGIVPKGNPDRIAASSARNYGAYSLDGIMDLTSEGFQTAHGGYDQTFANDDPDRVLPVDVLRIMEKEGRIGRLFPTFFATVGNGTAVADAARWGGEIGRKLRDANVQAVILTST